MSPYEIFSLLTSVLVILFAAHGCGRLMSLIRQPPVIGEILGGILLGPSFLGWISPEWQSVLVHETALPAIAFAAQIGLILYLFSVGLDLDSAVIRRRGRQVLVVAACSIAFPFAIGIGFAPALFPTLAAEGANEVSFAVFIGVAMSITAFPVLVRILTDLRLHKTEMGMVAISCAAIGDISAWCLLAIAVSMVGRSGSVHVLAFSGAFISFLVGTILAFTGRRFEWAQRLQEPVKFFLLPLFFAHSGMRTDLRLLNDTGDLRTCVLIVLLATFGKAGCTFIAARVSGFRNHEAGVLGVLMNTRGLVELIVLNVGLDVGLISPRLFAMMVVMALVTTLATSPIIIRMTKVRY